MNTLITDSLRINSLKALQCTTPTEKVQMVFGLYERYWDCPEIEIGITTKVISPDPDSLPGRPAQPILRDPRQVPQRSIHTPEGRGALLHAIAHIEFNAINLALDAIWRFSDLPAQFYQDWLRVAYEEAQHFSMLRERLASLNFQYGDFAAHHGLWEMAAKTADDVLARMALVPRTLEARGLDVSPSIRDKFLQIKDEASANVLHIILQEEIGHVAIGNYWFHYLCQIQHLNPIKTYEQLAICHDAPRLRPPFNWEARRAAGFSEEELFTLRTTTA